MGRTQAVHSQYEQSHFTCCTTLPAASKAFYTNTPRVVNKMIAMRDCVGYVYVVVMPIASSAHPMVYKMFPSIVGRPRDLDETVP